MITIRAKFDNGNEIVTGINCTYNEAIAYYLGNKFNLGDGKGGDLMATCIKVELV